jgi:hypothetical protein
LCQRGPGRRKCNRENNEIGFVHKVRDNGLLGEFAGENFHSEHCFICTLFASVPSCPISQVPPGSITCHVSLDVGDGLARVQPFRTHFGTVHDGVTTVDGEGILEFGTAFLSKVILETWMSTRQSVSEWSLVGLVVDGAELDGSKS